GRLRRHRPQLPGGAAAAGVRGPVDRLGGARADRAGRVGPGRGQSRRGRGGRVAFLPTAGVGRGLIGPAVSALVAASLGWRWVFLGLLPLVLASGALAWPSLRRLPPPPPPRAAPLRAAGVAPGPGRPLAGLTSRSPLVGALLVPAGLAVGLVPLRRLLPPGTLTASADLPVAVLSR